MRALSVFLVLTAATLQGCLAQKRRPLPSDLLRPTTWSSNLALSPDGKKIAAGHRTLNDDGFTFTAEVWLLNLETQALPFAGPLAAFPNGRSAAWAPDSSAVAFLQNGQIYITPHNGTGSGCALTPVTNVADGVSAFEWSPDGKRIAFTSTPSLELDLPDGVQIFTDTVFRFFSSIISPASPPPQIFVVDVPALGSCAAPDARQITNIAPSVSSATLSFWSNDGSSIYYTTDNVRNTDFNPGNATLWRIEVDGEASAEVVLDLVEPGSGLPLGGAPDLFPSPDGSRVALALGDPDAPSGFQQPDIFLLDLATGAYTNLTRDYDREVAFGGVIVWRDDNTIFTVNGDAGTTNLIKIDISTKTVTPIWAQDDHTISQLAIGGNKTITTEATHVVPREMFLVDEATGNRTKLTAWNQFLLDEIEAPEAPESVTWQGPGGETLQGWLYKPYNFDASKSYPLMTYPHGGPFSAWYATYAPDFHSFVSADYFLFLPNPRGSSSFSQAIASALAVGWPGPEYEDVLAGIDSLLAKYPSIDGTKLALKGGSASAILVDWAITHTTRFAAASAMSDIADNRCYWFLGDQPVFQYDENDKPFDVWQPAADIELSPITYALNVSRTTPTLYMQGTKDYRTPPGCGSEMMYRLLRYLRVPTALIQFEGAGHSMGAQASEDVRHQALTDTYTLKWFEQHLRGIVAPEFANLNVS